MKTAYYIISLFIITAFAAAQEQTLIGEEGVVHGGYGAPVIKMTLVNNDYGVIVGGRGGWIINHSFAVGFGGYGLANNVKAKSIGPNGEPFLELGYGGLELEYIDRSDDLIHLSVNTLIGGGEAGFRSRWEDSMGDDDNDWRDMDDRDHRERDTFFILEPGANIDLNITPWFRTSFGTSYRYVMGLSSKAATNSSIGGLSGTLTLRFGKF